jgi:hypothetical protein
LLINNRKSEALQRLDQLTHLNNAQRQLAIQQINNAETSDLRLLSLSSPFNACFAAVTASFNLITSSAVKFCVNADTQVKRVYDEAVDKAKEALNKATGQNLTAELLIC